MSSPGQLRALTRLAPALRPHLPSLVDRTVSRIFTTIDAYRDQSVLTPDEFRSIVRDNFDYLLNHEPGTAEPDASPPRETGHLHAYRGIPLPDVLSAYRIGFALLWDTITRLLLDSEAVDTGQVIEAATEMWWRADHFGQDVTKAYRDATTEILLRQERERSAMVEALVTATIIEQPALWEMASRLGIPYTGRFVVAVVAVEPLGSDPVPGVVGALQEQKIVSAWRLAPHQAIGVLSLPDPDTTRAAKCIERHALGNVGLSPTFTQLSAAPRAYYLAGVALRSRPRPDVRVRRFDDTPLAILVAAAPDAAAAIAHQILGALVELSEHERDTLLDTLEIWLQCDGSISEAATRLYCHSNTIRYRLRKLAEYTGRSVESPTATSELNAALQAWRLIGQAVEDDH
jgi:PucR C-terminal helix-turn-helix domain/GGDEF-like domain